MKKSLITFIEALHHYPDHFQERQLQCFLEDSEIELLKNLGILKQGSDLKEITCQSCDDDHFLDVQVENEKPYSFCPASDIARNYIDPQELTTWHFDVEKFLQTMALKLGMEDRVEKLDIPHLWQIGGFAHDDTRYHCYYYQGRKFNEALDFLEQQPHAMRRYVIFVNQRVLVLSQVTNQNLVWTEMNGYAELKGKQLVFNKKLFQEFLINGFRSVLFDRKNGDLTVNGRPICSIIPSSPEYYFAEILWKNFNEPVSHQKIVNYIYEKTRKEYADTTGKLCHKLKKKIKDAAEEAQIIDEIFKTTTDLNGENAYIMRNPS